MNHEELSDLLQRVSYKPGWRLHLSEGGDSGRAWLQVRFGAADAVTGELIMHHGRKWFLSPHMTQSEVILTAFKAFATAEEHECREAFRFDGQQVCGPHINLLKLARLMEAGVIGMQERPELKAAGPSSDSDSRAASGSGGS